MKVVLTFDHDEYGKAESTVDLDDADAARLLREGNARLTPQAVAASTRTRKPPKKATAKNAAAPTTDNEKG